MTQDGTPQRPMRVALCVTCLADAIRPEVGVATVRLLHRLGVTVASPLAQTCGGQPAWQAGGRSAARVMARRHLEILASYTDVVVPSDPCAAMPRHFSPALFVDDPVLGAQATSRADRTYALSVFLTGPSRTGDIARKVDRVYASHRRRHHAWR